MASSGSGSVPPTQQQQLLHDSGSSVRARGTMPAPDPAAPTDQLVSKAQDTATEDDAQRLLRLINLSEVLREELQAALLAAGASELKLPADLTDQQLLSMSEADVHAHYHQPRQPQPLHATLEQLRQRFPPQEHTPEFRAFLPSAATAGGQQPPSPPAAVVICFHAAGTAEDMWTSTGTGSRRVPSPLLEACAQHGWLLLAPQLPGRGQRMREPPLTSLQAAAQVLLPLVAPAVLAAGGRYAVVAHSMGAWFAYELLLLMQQEGFGEPAAACLGAMPWPHIPAQQRPWRQQCLLSDEEFKAECRAWGINDAVFGMWDLFRPMLRADFRLFDEYLPTSSAPQHVLGPRCLLRLFWGAHDTRVSRGMVQGWLRYTGRTGALEEAAADGELVCVQGGHLWPVADPAAKAAWLSEVARALCAALPTQLEAGT